MDYVFATAGRFVRHLEESLPNPEVSEVSKTIFHRWRNRLRVQATQVQDCLSAAAFLFGLFLLWAPYGDPESLPMLVFFIFFSLAVATRWPIPQKSV